MEQPKIIVLATVPREFECVKNHFRTCSNKLERFCTCQMQLNSYWKSEMYVTMSMPRVTQKSLLTYAVETPRGEDPLLQSKRSSPAVNCGPGGPTHSLCPLLYAALITTIPLFVISTENLAPYSNAWRRNECGRWRRSPYIPGGLKVHGKKLVVRARQ